MPVISQRSDFFESCQELHQFLLACQQRSIQEQQVKIASISTPLDGVDPLVAIHQFASDYHYHFYFENPRRGEAIAAFDTALAHVSCQPNSQRFTQAKLFWEQCTQQLLIEGSKDLPFSGPHFFGAFTFFDQVGVEAPFPPASLILPRWQIARQQQRGALVMNVVLDACVNVIALAETLWQQWQQWQDLRYRTLPPLPRSPLPIATPRIVGAARFKRSVQATMQAIQAQRLAKVVLAHTLDIQGLHAIQLAGSLHNLRQRYPACSIFAISNGQGQSFLGASPERLISIRQREFVTDALAGSSPRGHTAMEDYQFADRLQQSAKERHEHDIVVQFITTQLKQMGLQPLSAVIPGLLRLSNIQHLHTPIRAKLPDSVHPLDILAQLHPTPAVAGMPRQLACDEIRQHEAFERSLYAAPIGWIDHQGNCEFVVGIRSALIQGNQARLFAGAGIVAGSDPDREFAEVQLKLRVLLGALM